jgi:hypothetical protein
MEVQIDRNHDSVEVTGIMKILDMTEKRTMEPY